MPSLSDWKVPPNDQPRPADYAFDLAVAIGAVVGLRAMIPEDAFTAQMLGTERAGNGVVIRDSGLVLTIGYLITEAETIWLSPVAGPPVQGHALAYDQETGFGLVQALARLSAPGLPIGNSARGLPGAATPSAARSTTTPPAMSRTSAGISRVSLRRATVHGHGRPATVRPGAAEGGADGSRDPAVLPETDLRRQPQTGGLRG